MKRKLKRTVMKEDEIRQIVFKRDNYRCRYCGANKNLEAHHIISKEEQELMGMDDPTLSKMMDQPEYRITLCTEHHTLTFITNAVKHFGFDEEKERKAEQKNIDTQIRELSKRRRELKRSWSIQTDPILYQDKKQQINDKLKQMEKRKMEIVEQKNIRTPGLIEETRRIRTQVIRICEEHLLNVEMKRHESGKIKPF